VRVAVEEEVRTAGIVHVDESDDMYS